MTSIIEPTVNKTIPTSVSWMYCCSQERCTDSHGLVHRGDGSINTQDSYVQNRLEWAKKPRGLPVIPTNVHPRLGRKNHHNVITQYLMHSEYARHGQVNTTHIVHDEFMHRTEVESDSVRVT